MDGVDERPGGATGVRIVGDRVHRRTGPWTPAVHELMGHVRAAGFMEVPEVVGFDDGGDEVLRFIDGASDIVAPLGAAQLVAVGRLLASLRAAMATFRSPPSAVWRTRGDGPELAHGDVAPWNLVFDGDRIAGLLDWDFAGPNIAGYDLAYAAWTCIPLEPDGGVSVAECQDRLAVLLDAAAVPVEERRQLLSVVAYAQARVAFHVAHGGMTGELGLPWIWNEGRRMGGIGRSMAWLDDHWDELQEALR